MRTYPPKQEACPDCGGELKHLGEDVSEMLEIEPARFKVIRQVRPKLACACCERIVQAEAPSRPIARGIAGPGLLAHVLVSKYGDHLPLYRQSEIYAREGVELDRSTLADWVSGTSQLFEPLVEALRRHVMAAQKLHADDTPVPVLAPGNGKTKTGRLWTYVRDDRPAGDQTPPAVWFAYSPDRKGEHPQAHLSKFQGTLQADGYAGFEQIYEAGRIQEAACWAHVRRKFYDLQEAHKSLVAEEALERIGALYAVESDINGRSPEERREIRNTRSRPLLESLKQWLEETLGKLSKKSDTAMAVRYALGRWDALMRYCDDGRLGDRQQHSGTSIARCGSRQKELLVRRIGSRWRKRRSDLQPHRNGETEWNRSRKLSTERPGAHRGTPDQSHRGTASVEFRCRLYRNLKSRCLIKTARQHGLRNLHGIFFPDFGLCSCPAT